MKSKIRIVHIASGDAWGGAESQLLGLISALRSIGDVEVSLIILNRGLLRDRVRALDINCTLIDENNLHSLGLILSMRRAIRATDPHIVHTHGYKQNIIGSILAFFRRKSISVRTQHGDWEIAGRWWSVSNLMRGLDLCIAKTLQTRFIVVSDDLAKTYQRKISHRKLVVIKNGVDVANLEKAYDRRPTMHDDRAYRILFVGRLVPVKRVDLLLEAAALLGQRGGMQIQIDIYGEGPEAVDLVKKSVALGLATQVSFCGFSENVADELCRADLLVMTSDHEGLPMVLLEALFLRVPVVAPAVGGIPEVLQPRFGELVYDQEPAAYAEAISKCIDRRAELKTNLELAPVLIRQKHSTETQANAYADMYRQLIS